MAGVSGLQGLPTSDDSAFDVGAWTANEGNYTYFCPPHKGFMRGSIRVVGSGSDMGTGTGASGSAGRKEKIFPARFTLCSVENKVGGKISLAQIGFASCSSKGYGIEAHIFTTNPAVDFDVVQARSTQVFRSNVVTVHPVLLRNGSAVLVKGRAHAKCTGISHFGESFIGVGENPTTTFYRHDRRTALKSNTLEEPADTVFDAQSPGRSTVCPTVPVTFLNEQSCVRREAGSCSRPSFSSAPMTLDHDTLLAW